MRTGINFGIESGMQIAIIKDSSSGINFFNGSFLGRKKVPFGSFSSLSFQIVLVLPLVGPYQEF